MIIASNSVDSLFVSLVVSSFLCALVLTRRSSMKHNTFFFPTTTQKSVKIHPNGPLGKSKKGSILGRTTSDINDCYTFHEELGKGQFGTTYKIKDKKTGKEYACKAIAKRKLTTKEDQDDVRREISILHHLNGHDNVVSYIGSFEGARHVYIVMELLCGGELFDRIVERGKYSEKDAADCFRTIVETIQHCHELGVVHRDLKPENFVLQSKDYNSKICAIDFGLSAFFSEGQKFHEIVGSAYYVAPEVLRRSYGKQSDVWSCGVILYILLSGVPPFWATTENGIFDMVLKGEYDMEQDPWGSISAGAKDLISKMLVQNAEKRITADEALNHPWLTGGAPAKKLDNAVVKRLKSFAAITKFKKLGLIAMAKTLSADELEGLKEMFKSFDTDQSGTISIAELQAGLRKKGSSAATEELQQLMNEIDIDGNGELDYEEFVAATLSMANQHNTDAMEKTFQYFDADGDGTITIDEFRMALDKMPPGARANFGDVNELVEMADQDGDGLIDYEEFVAMMTAGDKPDKNAMKNAKMAGYA